MLSLREMHRRMAGPFVLSPWRLLQSTFTPANPGSFPNPVHPGSLLLARTGYENSGPAVLTDTSGNTWTSVIQAQFGTVNIFFQELHYAVHNGSVSNPAITASGVAPFFGFVLTEWFGNSSTPLDISSPKKVNNETGSVLNGCSVPVAKPRELLYCSWDGASHDAVPQSPTIPLGVSPHEGYFVTGPSGIYIPVAFSGGVGLYSQLAASFIHR